MITISVETRQAVLEQTEIITTGSVGIQCHFSFSSDWDGLNRVAVFRVGDKNDWYDIILDETNTCPVPWELMTLENEGEPLFIGVEGTDALTNTLVVPTIWVSAGAIKPGAHSGNAEGADPTPTQWSQIRSLAEQAASDAESAQESAETAETYMEHAPTITNDYWYTWNGTAYESTGQKAKGDTGNPGQDGADGTDGISPEVTIADITNGHSITITDADHPSGQTFNVLNGEDGQDGAPGQDGQDGAVGPTGIAVQNTAPTHGELMWLDTDADPIAVPEIADTAIRANDTWSSQKISSEVSLLQDELGIVITGDQTSVGASSGQYVILKNSTITGCADGLYTASQTIPANTSIDSTYLTAVTGGGLNSLNEKTIYIHAWWNGNIPSGESDIRWTDLHMTVPSGYTPIRAIPYSESHGYMWYQIVFSAWGGSERGLAFYSGYSMSNLTIDFVVECMRTDDFEAAKTR